MFLPATAVMKIMMAPGVTRIAANPIITISRAMSGSTRAIAEKKRSKIVFINRTIKVALGISSLYKDLSADFSAQGDNSHPNPKIEAAIIKSLKGNKS